MNLQERMRLALRAAVRDRDRVAVAALRSALGVLDNATAVPSVPIPAVGAGAVAAGLTGTEARADGAGAGAGAAGARADGAGAGTAGAGGAGAVGGGRVGEHVAGAVVGVGAAEVARRELTGAEMIAVVRGEIDALLAAAEAYPPGPAADQLRAEAEILVTLASQA